jgi:hypothetical protein
LVCSAIFGAKKLAVAVDFFEKYTACRAGASWRVDETYVKIKGKLGRLRIKDSRAPKHGMPEPTIRRLRHLAS